MRNKQRREVCRYSPLSICGVCRRLFNRRSRPCCQCFRMFERRLVDPHLTSFRGEGAEEIASDKVTNTQAFSAGCFRVSLASFKFFFDVDAARFGPSVIRNGFAGFRKGGTSEFGDEEGERVGGRGVRFGRRRVVLGLLICHPTFDLLSSRG